jgi:ADP-heptose:LPS heptosyltransferase
MACQSSYRVSIQKLPRVDRRVCTAPYIHVCVNAFAINPTASLFLSSRSETQHGSATQRRKDSGLTPNPPLRQACEIPSLRTFKRVAFFRALYLGDMLCAIPAARALRKALPEAQVTLVGMPWAESLVERYAEYFDAFLGFPNHPGLHEDPAPSEAIDSFYSAVASRNFDLVLQLHGDGRLSNAIASRMGRVVSGYHPHELPAPSNGWYLPYPNAGSEVERLLRVVSALGIQDDGPELEFRLSHEDLQEAGKLRNEASVGVDGYICVHPGSKLESRRWPTERFAAVADALANQGLRVFLTGSESERDLTGAVAEAMGFPSLDLAGRTTLGGLAALIAGARLLVANDTGVSHVAAALRVPSVIVASGSDVERWAPANRSLHRVLWHDVECRPCAYDHCPVGHPCALGVATDQAIGAAMALLEPVTEASRAAV